MKKTENCEKCSKREIDAKRAADTAEAENREYTREMARRGRWLGDVKEVYREHRLLGESFCIKENNRALYWQAAIVGIATILILAIR